MLRFIYYEDKTAYKRYLIGIENNNKTQLLNIQHLIPKLLKLNKKDFIKLVRDFGGKIDIFENFYFNDEQLVKQFVEQLNILKKLN